MGNIRRHHVRSKLDVTFLLSETPVTAVYVPDTRLLYKDSFYKMLKAYSEVYIKPDKGVQGLGIIHVQKMDDRQFLIRTNRYNVHCYDIHTLWRVLYKLTNHSKYVIQKAIRSRTIHGLPFDIRIHVFRVNGIWKVGVMYARVDSRDKVTTNVSLGGTSVLLETLFKEHLQYDDQSRGQMLDRLTNCAEIIAGTVNGMYPPFKEYGIDVGIDEKQRPWVYEVNINPMPPDKKIAGDGSVYVHYREIKSLSS